MGSYLGNLRAAATRIGVSYSDYFAYVASGLKWCSYGKHWEKIVYFPPDRNRQSGKAQACKRCQELYHRKRQAEGKNKRRKAWPVEKNRQRARDTVKCAIRDGQMPPAGALPCHHCGHLGGDKRHGYHHYLGYGQEHILDVIPLCSRCHNIEERRIRGLVTFVLESAIEEATCRVNG